MATELAAAQQIVPKDYIAKSNDELLHRLQSRLPEESVITGCLLAIVFLATRLWTEHMLPVAVFAVIFGVITFAKLALARWAEAKESHIVGLAAISGLFFSILSIFSVFEYAVSWTSFFVLMVCMGISIASLTTYVHMRATLRAYLLMYFFPTTLGILIAMPGIHGASLAVFEVGMFFLLWFIGHNQEQILREKLVAEARLLAMLDAIPGTLSWVSRDMVYQGVNKHLASVFKGKPEEFVGKFLGHRDSGSPILQFTEQLFKRAGQQASMISEIDIDGERREYYIVGRKYNHDREAVIIGVDIKELGDKRS
jgi:hypothetical protein